ncbi:MAG: helix-turn-helix transcriptional regulator [Chloroflexota bacterium]
MSERERYPLRAKLRLLLTCTFAPQPIPSFRELASQTGLSDQTWDNLLSGKSANPRLSTLRKLCLYFEVSLDFFAYQTEAETQAYLYQTRLRGKSLYIAKIESAANALSQTGQYNVLALMEWMQRADLADRRRQLQHPGKDPQYAANPHD